MSVIDFQPILELLQHIVWYHVAVFELSAFLHTRVSLGWVIGDVSTLQEIFAKGFEPCQIIVSGAQSVVSVNKHIVQELSDQKVVELIGVIQVYLLLCLMLCSFRSFNKYSSYRSHASSNEVYSRGCTTSIHGFHPCISFSVNLLIRASPYARCALLPFTWPSMNFLMHILPLDGSKADNDT